eukprot:694778-Pleurochrysis_carterae.AAC.2
MREKTGAAPTASSSSNTPTERRRQKQIGDASQRKQRHIVRKRGVGDGGRAGGRDEQPAITGAVSELEVSAYDVVSLVMLGGGRKFPHIPRKFKCCAPIRKRTLPSTVTFNKEAAPTRAAKEI